MRAFARSIVETVRHPLLVLDAGLRVIAANAPFYHSFPGEPAGTEGRRLHDLGGGRWDIPALRGLLERVIPTGVHFEGLEVDHEFPGLGRRQLVLSARVVRGDDDPAPMVLLAIEDHTNRLRSRDELRWANAALEERVAARTADLAAANRELREANRELAAANRELEAFCYSVSHDLRAPLRAIDGFSRELLDAYADRLDDQGRHYLTRVRAGTQRMGQLIDDLLNLSRVSRAEMCRERVDLTAMAEAVVGELRQRDPGRRVAFTARPGLAVDADPRLVRVVLENLLGNAWKFTSRRPEAAIEFGREEHRGRAAFCVRDDGAGFDMAYADKLFGAFQRLHPDREFPGTGVGLATVQRVVRRHGGEVWAEGEPGRGAAFYFTLPGPGDPS
ncbi:MAG: hypothetical protein C0501_04635 [Isosphaera sp.]|nr:hypothetical protein [Isosphaera sp.]